MPIQTSDSFQAGKPEPMVEPVEAPTEVPVEIVVCGHINRHYTGTEELKCYLRPGHTGNHIGFYNRSGEVVETAWKDEAGYAINK